MMPIRAGRRLVLATALALLVLPATGAPSLAGTSAASARLPGAARSGAADEERRKVFVTIESRISDWKALEKMREKIEVLGGSKLRLAAALCDRMTGDAGSAGADIAFSLVTALIVLS